MARGIVAYGAYVPYYRLQRAAIGAALGAGGGKGTRAVASFDEDTTSMGVEAARIAMRAAPADMPPAVVLFATAVARRISTRRTPPRSTPRSVLPRCCRSTWSARCVSASRRSARQRRAAPILAVLSDIRTGLPGGADERDGGDAAVAFLFLARCSTAGARRAHRRRVRRRTSSSTAGGCPARVASHVWEERFGEHAYVPLAETAINDALKQAGITPSELDHVDRRRPPRPRGQARRRRDRRAARGDRRRPRRASSATPAPRTRPSRSPTCSTAPSPARRS